MPEQRGAARVIEPPREQLDQLLTPLTEGERKVLDLFDKKLSADWEIYVQPHLNGLRPDIVLLNPRVGVAVFEIKDWNLRSYRAGEDSAGNALLIGHDASGKEFVRQKSNPINQILLYKKELFELYCPRLDQRAGRAVITAGLVFPCAPRSEVERVFGPLRKARKGMDRYPRYYPIAAAEDVSSGNLEAIFPESGRSSSSVMTEAIAEDLRGWMKEPFFSQQQRKSLQLDREQRRLAATRTPTGDRRIKGPAGSGKSVVLAARAAELAAEGKHALVVSFNITLLNYLRDLAVRHVAEHRVIRRQIDFLHFHGWCRRICLATGNDQEHRRLWAEALDHESEAEPRDNDAERRKVKDVLNDRLPQLVRRIYLGGAGRPRYDAILVDEGQDFHPSWWRTLRLALKPGGEMILVADKTQNVYGTAGAWTERAMENAGFRGPWAQLESSYRLSPGVVPLVRSFAREFLTDEEVDVPAEEPQTEIHLFPVELRWLHVGGLSNTLDENALDACDAELGRMMKRLQPDTALADITFLSGTADFGRKFVKRQSRKGVKVRHTFHPNRRRSQRQKRAFFQGDARIKATTIHSFKGWEARHLILCVQSVKRPEERALLYTALTRLRRHEQGSCLSVVSCCDELRAFGRFWPEYEEF